MSYQSEAQLEERLRRLEGAYFDALHQISIGNLEEIKIEKLTKELGRIDHRLKEEIENGSN